MTKAAILLLGGLISCSFHDAAMAQNTEVNPEPAKASATDSDSRLGEIVVTAQRRSESLQNVPIAVTALSAKALNNAGIIDTLALAQLTPGLVFRQTIGVGQPFLRGIGAYNTSVGDESPTAVYVDGIYIASTNGNIFGLNNITRVEVLKGPQGTLFGRNAAAGVIQIITRDPQTTPAGDLTASYGSYDRVRLSGYATGGITNRLAADISVLYDNQHDGWGRNIVVDRKAFYRKNIALRSKWLLDFDSTKITVAADYNRLEGDFGSRMTPTPESRGLDGAVYSGFYTQLSDLTAKTVDRQGGFMARVDQELPFANLVSLSSWRKVRADDPIDQDNGPRVFGTADITVKQVTYSQELQLLSNNKSTAFNWVTGLFYFHDNAQYDPLSIRISSVAVTQPVFIPALGTTINAPTGIFDIPQLVIPIRTRQKTESYSAFGQATVEVLRATDLIVGVRYTSDRRSLIGSVGTGPVAMDHKTFNKVTYKISLDHKFGEGVLGYIQRSRGFKSGLYNLVSPYSAPVAPSIVDAYEAGIKTEFLNKSVRLNAAAFKYDLKNIQVNAIVLGSTALFNAAAATVKGAEVDLEVAPVHDLRLKASAAYLDAKFDSFVGAPLYYPNPFPNPLGGPAGFVSYAGDASGSRMPNAPKWTMNGGADYSIESAIGRFSFSLNASYSSRSYALDNKFSVPPFVIANATLGWRSLDERWSVRAIGRNIFDQHYLLARGPGFVPASLGQSPGEPRTIELELGLHW